MDFMKRKKNTAKYCKVCVHEKTNTSTGTYIFVAIWYINNYASSRFHV